MEVKDMGRLACVTTGSACKRTLFANGVGARQQVKIWSLDDYAPSLYSWKIVECEVNPQQTNQRCHSHDARLS